MTMHLATPRTLLFLERDGLWLFLRGAPSKWFAGRLNGLGGRVEAGEGVLTAARRECVEETGLAPLSLRLAAVVHTIEDPPVLMFVCVGTLPPGELSATPEGEHVWLAADALADPDHAFVDDLRLLFPRVTGHTADTRPLSFTLRPPAELREDPGRDVTGSLG
jgi:8-oxo-dGTP diphosphatase